MRHHGVVAALLVAGSILTPPLSAAPVAAAAETRSVALSGQAQLVVQQEGPAAGLAAPELAPGADLIRKGEQGEPIPLRTFQPGEARANVAGAAVAAPAVGQAPPRVVRSFSGLNLRNQRLANGGNQFTVEPPDQGLCIGNGFIVESVNSVLRVFDTAGNPLTGVVDLNTFYGYPAQLNRTTGDQGPFVTDPTCWFDVETGRFFHLVLTLEVFPDNGDFTGVNHLDLAVSRSSNPLDGFVIYRTDVTDDGTNGTPNHGCPAGPTPRRATIRQPTRTRVSVTSHTSAPTTTAFL